MYKHTLPVQFVDEEPDPQLISGNLLTKEYKYWNTWLALQNAEEKMMILLQANKLAGALSQENKEVTITMPNSLEFPVSGNGQKETIRLTLPLANQQLSIPNKRKWFTRETLFQATQKQLVSLERSSNPVVAAFGGLLRFAAAQSLICDCLPAGKQVAYSVIPGEDVPSIPEDNGLPKPAAGFSKALFASLFYLPQWVAFNEDGQLLVDSIDEAENCILAMDHYLRVLYLAESLAPYMVVDRIYRQKYYGILGQWVNQSRGLCRYRTDEIIKTIRRRSTSKSLNRGLRITMPYFDDQALVLRKLEFEIIPSGRVMFVPAFVIMTVQQQMTLVQHDTTLNFSTRRHLLDQLERLLKSM